MKKIVSIILSTILAIGTLPSAMAEGEIVYTYEDDNQATVNVTESDIIAGN